MNYSKAFQYVLTEIIAQMSRLSNSDFEKLVDGTYEISVNVRKKRISSLLSTDSNYPIKEKVVGKLYKCKSREESISILTDAFKNKKELEQFAKSIDVLVLKQDKLENIRIKVIEATVGAVLRSNAIQGKKTLEQPGIERPKEILFNDSD